VAKDVQTKGVQVVKQRPAIVAKEKEVQEIKDKLERAKTVVLIDYRGINTAEVYELRNEFRDAGVEYKVYKNTLVKRALHEMGHKDFDEALNGTTGFIFSYADEVTGAKIISDAIVKYKKMSIKCGLVDGAYTDAVGVKTLATLPPKEVLIAQLLGMLNQPITGLAGVLAAILKQPLYVLQRIAEKQA